MRTYHQLTQAHRYQIYALQKTKHTQAETAKVMGVHKSRFSRELKRNLAVIIRAIVGNLQCPTHYPATEEYEKSATAFD